MNFPAGSVGKTQKTRNTRAVLIYPFLGFSPKDFYLGLVIIGNKTDVQKRERETNNAANKY
jgi:hypothetical protein